MFTGEGDLRFKEDGGQWSDSCRVFIRLVNSDHLVDSNHILPFLFFLLLDAAVGTKAYGARLTYHILT